MTVLGADMVGATKLISGVAATLGNAAQGGWCKRNFRTSLAPHHPSQEIHH